MDKHHIIFKSQGGLNFKLNLKLIPHDFHIGDNGPHKNRETDLKYKKELQAKLQALFIEKYYTREQIIEKLELNTRDTRRLFKTLKSYKEGYKTEDLIRRLMGGKLY